MRLPFTDDPSQFRQGGHLGIEPEQLRHQGGLQPLDTFRVRHSALDMNGHVNNVRFAEWLLDSASPHLPSGHSLESYQMNFLAEAHLGDELVVLGRLDNGETWLEGRRSSDGTVLFVTQLK